MADKTGLESPGAAPGRNVSAGQREFAGDEPPRMRIGGSSEAAWVAKRLG